MLIRIDNANGRLRCHGQNSRLKLRLGWSFSTLIEIVPRQFGGIGDKLMEVPYRLNKGRARLIEGVPHDFGSGDCDATSLTITEVGTTIVFDAVFDNEQSVGAQHRCFKRRNEIFKV